MDNQSLAISSFKFRQSLALLILLCLLFLLYFVVANPIINLFSEMNDELAWNTQQVQKYSRVAGESEKTTQQLEEVKIQISDSDLFLKSNNRSMASAELQRIVKSYISESGGRLVSLQNVNVTKKDLLSSVSIRVHLKSDMNVLVDILHGLETSLPFIILEKIKITPNQGKFVKYKTRSVSSEQLDVRFDVSGFLINIESGENR